MYKFRSENYLIKLTIIPLTKLLKLTLHTLLAKEENEYGKSE